MIALSDYDLPVYTERIKRNTDTESYPLCSVSTGLFWNLKFENEISKWKMDEGHSQQNNTKVH